MKLFISYNLTDSELSCNLYFLSLFTKEVGKFVFSHRQAKSK